MFTDRPLERGYTITASDGALVRIEETPDRLRLLISLTRGAHSETARLDRAQWETLCDLKDKLEVFAHQEEAEQSMEDARQEPDDIDRAKADMEARGER